MFTSLGLAYAYPGRAELRFPDVELAAGKRLLILGASGAGKSTLLGLWAGLLSPKRGSVTLGGVRVDALQSAARDRWRGRHVGLVFQSARLVASQSVASNIQLPRKLAGLPTLPTPELAARGARLGVEHLLGRAPEDCSVGERQRVGILRALAADPSLILADEPTSALDRANALAVGKLLCEHAEASGAALAVVTHDDRLRPLFSETLEIDAGQ